MAEVHGRPPDLHTIAICHLLFQAHTIFLQTVASLLRAPSVGVLAEPPPTIDTATPLIAASGALTISLFNAIFGSACPSSASSLLSDVCPTRGLPRPFTVVSRKPQRRHGSLGRRFGGNSGRVFPGQLAQLARLDSIVEDASNILLNNTFDVLTEEVPLPVGETDGLSGPTLEVQPSNLMTRSLAAVVTEAPVAEADVGHVASPSPTCTLPLNTFEATRNEDSGDDNEHNDGSDSSGNNDDVSRTPTLTDDFSCTNLDNLGTAGIIGTPNNDTFRDEGSEEESDPAVFTTAHDHHDDTMDSDTDGDIDPRTRDPRYLAMLAGMRAEGHDVGAWAFSPKADDEVIGSFAECGVTATCTIISSRTESGDPEIEADDSDEAWVSDDESEASSSDIQRSWRKSDKLNELFASSSMAEEANLVTCDSSTLNLKVGLNLAAPTVARPQTSPVCSSAAHRASAPKQKSTSSCQRLGDPLILAPHIPCEVRPTDVRHVPDACLWDDLYSDDVYQQFSRPLLSFFGGRECLALLAVSKAHLGHLSDM